jgi:CRP-like cAMP-binding protein
LFRRLEPHELEHLAEEVEQVNYKAGEIIFHEYDNGDALRDRRRSRAHLGD